MGRADPKLEPTASMAPLSRALRGVATEREGLGEPQRGLRGVEGGGGSKRRCTSRCAVAPSGARAVFCALRLASMPRARAWTWVAALCCTAASWCAAVGVGPGREPIPSLLSFWRAASPRHAAPSNLSFGAGLLAGLAPPSSRITFLFRRSRHADRGRTGAARAGGAFGPPYDEGAQGDTAASGSGWSRCCGKRARSTTGTAFVLHCR